MQYMPRNRDSFMDQLNPFANHMFQHAVMQGDMAIVSLMLKHGIVVRRNERNRHGLTALQQSVLDGNNRLAMCLMESGADLEAKTSNGWTSLHIAAATGNINMVCLLIGHCADVVALTSNDELPIDLAMNVDMKIVLANEMSRCGYIELSQWYMGKISPQETGVFYVMSADSLLEIACESPELHATDNYGLYPPTTMHSYSSMINLPRSNGSDSNVHFLPRAKTRKGSVWSLPQHSNHPLKYDEAQSRPIPWRNKSEQEYNNRLDSSWANKHDSVPKSFSSGYLSDSLDAYNVREQDEISMKSSKARMTTCLETEPGEDTCFSDQQVFISNVTESGTMRRIKRKVSVKRKASDSFPQYNTEWMEEGVKPVQVNIDYYYQASIEHEDEFEEDGDYLEFRSNGRPRLSSSTSSSSLGCRNSMRVSSSGSLIEYGDVPETGTSKFSGDRTLLNEFADNSTEIAQLEGDSNTIAQYYTDYDIEPGNLNTNRAVVPFQTGTDQTALPYRIAAAPGPIPFDAAQNTAPAWFGTDQPAGPVPFEIDTVNGNDDQGGRKEITEADAILKARSLPGLVDEDIAFDDSNMYFNPMYRSVDNSSNDSPEKQPRGIPREKTGTLRETIQEAGGRVICGENHNNRKINYTGQNLEKDREFFNSDEEYKEGKRKKRGLLSELVSKFKGSVKLHKTSSDTNLSSPEEGAVIIKREAGKAKSLRRRRHVRRSNSFSSYFPPISEKAGKTSEKAQNKRMHSDEHRDEPPFESGTHSNENNLVLQLTERPYSPHRKDRSPLSPKRIQDSTQLSKQLSPMQCNDVGVVNRIVSGGRMHRKKEIENGGDPQIFGGKMNAKGGTNCAELVESCNSRIPVRSINTYSKGISVMDERPGQLDNGCMSMKFLCK